MLVHISWPHLVIGQISEHPIWESVRSRGKPLINKWVRRFGASWGQGQLFLPRAPILRVIYIAKSGGKSLLGHLHAQIHWPGSHGSLMFWKPSHMYLHTILPVTTAAMATIYWLFTVWVWLFARVLMSIDLPLQNYFSVIFLGWPSLMILFKIACILTPIGMTNLLLFNFSH